MSGLLLVPFLKQEACGQEPHFDAPPCFSATACSSGFFAAKRSVADTHPKHRRHHVAYPEGFLKLSAAAALTSAFSGVGLAPAKPKAARAAVDRIKQLKPEWSKQTTTVCCYCAVGCGLIVNTALEGTKRAINIEGDPDHPINEGALCAKGASASSSSPRAAPAT